ncbi:MAG: hypothetical protein U1F11_04370 [Steroidobacteraceae bacterium]
MLPRFLQRHPGIELTLHLDDRFVDPVAGGYDVRWCASRPCPRT